MWDERSFESRSFHPGSWLFYIIASVRHGGYRAYAFTKALTLAVLRRATST